jgi:hypothetical protein
MSLLDQISDLARKFAPPKSSKLMAGGIGGGHGIVPIDDDVSNSVPSDSFFHTLAGSGGLSVPVT